MVALLFLLFSVAFGLAPLNDAGENAIEGRYIVKYKDEVELEAFRADVLTAVPAENVLYKYENAMKGFAATMTAEQLTTVRNNPLVDYVETDQVMKIAACSAKVSVVSWGLTRIAQEQQDLNGQYHYPTTAGKGVTVYVIDTGVYVDHSDFTGRAKFGFKAENGWSNTDANGHGTHVASTSVGIRYGVARQALVVAVKVLGDNGSGSNAGVIAGVEYAIVQHNSGSTKSVINMSLGGGYSSGLNQAVNAAVKAGIATVVAAGNEDSDACNGSPSSAADVLTIGSTDVGTLSAPDVRSYFSNWGECVDLFAPGSDITAAWIGGINAVRTISGTSMASPHVAGIAALLSSENTHWTGHQVQQHIISSATHNVITMECASRAACNKSPNKMAFNGCNN